MKKFLVLTCLLSVFCLAGCATKSSYIPSEKEILAEVADSVPVAYEYIKTEKSKTSTVCYFECKDRDLSFTASGYAAPNVPMIPMPQSAAGYTPVISVSYWIQIKDMYYPQIRPLFEDTDMVLYESDAMGHKEIQVLLKNEADLEHFVDLVMQGEEILAQEQAYVDESVLENINLMYYTVWVPYTQVYANGETANREERCIQFISNSTLDRDELVAEIEQAIADANKEIAGNENIVLYGQVK